MSMTIIDMGEGYFLKASTGQIGSFQIVSIDWAHPNYGYFTDAMLWFKSPHTMKWKPVPIVNWTEKYFIVVNGSRMINCKHQIVKHPNLNTQKMINKISIGEVVSNNKIDEDRVSFNKDCRDSNVKIVEYNNQLFDVRDDGNIVRLIDRKTGVIKKMYRSNKIELSPKKSENILDVLEKEIGC